MKTTNTAKGNDESVLRIPRGRTRHRMFAFRRNLGMFPILPKDARMGRVGEHGRELEPPKKVQPNDP